MNDWKTTLFGASFAVLNLIANGMGWKQALLSVAAAGLGYVSKDSASAPEPPAPSTGTSNPLAQSRPFRP